jgi:hypothetical protein
LIDPIRRGDQARQILENPLFNEAFEDLRAVYIGLLESLHAKDDLGRFRYTEALKQVKYVKAHLETVLAQGKLAEDEAKLAEENKVLSFIRKF